MNANATATTTTIHDQCGALVKDFITFQSAYALREEAETTLKDIRPKIVETLKGFKKEKKVWKDLKGEFAAAIADAKMADPTKKLEVVKLCYEHGILPTDWNSTRLKKAPTVLNWAGIRIPNPIVQSDRAKAAAEKAAAEKAKAEAEAKAKAEAEAKAKAEAEAKAVAEAEAKAKAAAPAHGTGTITTLPPQKTPAKKAGKAGKADADGTGSETAVTPFELFQTRFTAFTRDEITPHYICNLAALLKVEPVALSAAMMTAYDDLCKRSAKS